MPIINFFTSQQNNCMCRNNNDRTIILQRQNNNVRLQNERVSQFVTTGSILIQPDEIIPLSSTQFNNISNSVSLTSQGTIMLEEQGVYEIEYNVVVSNPNAVPLDIIITLVRNSTTPVVLSRAIATVEPNNTITLSNTFVNSVVSGTMQEIQLINASTDEVLIISANIVVHKIT